MNRRQIRRITTLVALTVPLAVAFAYPACPEDAGNAKNAAAATTGTAIGGAAAALDAKALPLEPVFDPAGDTTDGAVVIDAENTPSPKALVDDKNATTSKKKIIFKPGMPLTINTASENIRVTNDAKLAREQVANYPDSPEARFVLAVALTRTSQVEEALKEIRTARKLASAKGGAAYFDQMINEYEKMLEHYPEDLQVRYHLAWAYYMKAYVLARYSKQVVNQTPAALPVVAAKPAATASGSSPEATANASAPAALESADVQQKRSNDWRTDWVAQNTVLKPEEIDEKDVAESKEAKATQDAAAAQAAAKPGQANNFWANPLGSLANLGPITGMDYAKANAAPEVIPQIKGYYRRALKKLDEVLEKDPSDLWARLYRAHLGVEYDGNSIDSAMKVWDSCREEHPNNPAPYFFLGEGYLKKGDLRQCLTNVSKAIALRGLGSTN